MKKVQIVELSFELHESKLPPLFNPFTGEKLVDERVHIYSDPLNKQVPSNTWSGDGLPIKKTDWIKEFFE